MRRDSTPLFGKVNTNTIVFCIAFYLFLITILLLAIRWMTGGHLSYSLDDPYIHLALAENLAHGHYGINPIEFTSPSSSIVWPFLLIPFAGTSFHPYLPLVLNIICGALSAGLIGWAIAQWPPQVDSAGYMPWWQQASTGVLVIFSANLAALSFTGMEHVLQVLVAICCAIGMNEALDQRKIPMWCLAAAVLAPIVRYENLALTVAVCTALLGMRAWRRATTVFCLSVAPLIAFSIFLKSKGLPLLPLSVLIKGHVYKNGSALVKASELLAYNIYRDLTRMERLPILILFCIFVGLTIGAENRVRRFVFMGAALLGGLQLSMGRFGWGHRYEVYALAFLLLISLRVMHEQPKALFGYFALALLACSSLYIEATAQAPLASTDVYQQQYQMHRFVTEYYHGNYAVNDLGWVSYQRRPGSYVLDLVGLASLEAAQQITKSPSWYREIVKRHNVGLVIIYPTWASAPPPWTPMARMCVSDPAPAVLADRCVVFYGTIPSEVLMLHADLEAFSRSLPPGVSFEWAPSTKEAF